MSTARKPKNKLHLVVIFLVVAGFAGWFLRERWRSSGFNWSAFAASFLDIRWDWMAVAIALTLLTYFGRAMRWRVMIRPLRPHAGVWSLTEATMIGFTALVLLGRPGEFVRPYLIARKQNVPLSSQLAAWFLERIWDLLAVLLIFGFSVMHIADAGIHLGPRFAWVLQTGGWAAAITGVVCLTLLVLVSRYSDAMRNRLVQAIGFLPEKHRGGIERVITAFLQGAASTRTGGSLFLLVSYTLLEWTVIVLAIAAMLWAYPATAGLGIREVLAFTGFLAFGSLVQIPGIGGGMQIVSMVLLNEMFGVALETATGMAIMIWVISFVVVVPIGLGLAFHEGLNWRQFRALEKEAEAEAEQAGSGGLAG